MSVDLGQVVGRGIKTISISGTTMTITYTDNTSTNVTISNQNYESIVNAALDDAFNYGLVQDATGSHGGSVKVYANAFEVIIIASGTFTNLNTPTSSNTSALTGIGSLSSANSAYLPKSDFATSVMMLEGNPLTPGLDRNTDIFIRRSDNAIGIINRLDSNNQGHASLTIYGLIRYPLASRLP